MDLGSRIFYAFAVFGGLYWLFRGVQEFVSGEDAFLNGVDIVVAIGWLLLYAHLYRKQAQETT